MKKNILIMLAITSIAILITGCSNKENTEPKTSGTESTQSTSSSEKEPIDLSTLIPYPDGYFSEKATTILNDSQCWYQIKNCSVESYDSYVGSCKDKGFTVVHYEGDSNANKLYYAYDSENKYYLEVALNHETNQIDVNLTPVKNK